MIIKKLTYLFFTGACLLASVACSKDDETKGGVEGLSNATLRVEIKAAGVKTKAYNPNDLNELQGEANINNLAVVVFSEDGSQVLGSKWKAVQTEYSATLTDIPVKAANSRILIVANVPEQVINSITTFDNFQNSLVDLASQSKTSLTMSSRVIDTDKPLIAGDNYLGYSSMGSENVNGISSPIYLTRVPSRVDLVTVDTKFKGTKLEGYSVRLEQVSVVNRKTRAHYFSESEWGAVETAGNQDSSPVISFNTIINDANTLATTSYVGYVMENTETTAPTSIRLRASLVNANGNVIQTKLFTSAINLNGTSLGYGHNLIKRNYVYRLWITFGEDSFDPETELAVNVQVVNWGPVDQDVVIE